MSMMGGLPPPRNDQQYRPPGPPGPVGGAAGTLRARVLIIQGVIAGAFVYDATGALIASMAALANIDPLTKKNVPGIASYANAANLVAELTNGTLQFLSQAAATFVDLNAEIRLTDAVIASQAPSLDIEGPQTSAGNTADLRLFGESSDLSKPVQAVLGIASIFPVTPATGALFEVQGTEATAAIDVAPAGTAPPARPAGTEPWNYVGAAGQPAFGAGWSNFGGGFAGLAFKFVASPPRSVWIKGEVTHTAVAAQTIFTLPVAYRPASSQQFVCITNTSSIIGVEVSAAGAVELLIAPAALVTHNIDLLVSLDI